MCVRAPAMRGAFLFPLLSLAWGTFVDVNPPIPIYQPVLQGELVDYKPMIYTPNVLVDRSCMAKFGPFNPANASLFPVEGYQPYGLSIS